MMDGALRQEGNAEVAVEQSQEIVHRADLVRLLGDDAERLEGLRQRACRFAAGADEDALLLEPARVKAGWDTLHCSAARVKLSVRATAKK